MAAAIRIAAFYGISLTAERFHRVDARSAPCRHVTGDQRDHGKKNYCAAEDPRVHRTNAVQESGKQPADAGRERQPDDAADGGNRQALTEHHADDVAERRAERDANADLARAPRDAVRGDAVDADRRQEQSDETETRR